MLQYDAVLLADPTPSSHLVPLYAAVNCSELQCVTVCSSVQHCFALCCSVFQCAAALLPHPPPSHFLLPLYVVVHCSVLQCVAVCCSVLQCVAVLLRYFLFHLCHLFLCQCAREREREKGRKSVRECVSESECVRERERARERV